MRPTVGRFLILAIALAACGAFGGVSFAQGGGGDAAQAVSTVMSYRRNYLDDALPFDACAVQRAIGGGADYAARLLPQVREMLDNAASTCPRPFQQGRNAVVVDSVHVAESDTRVFVTVLRGELIHREDYLLRPAGTAALMAVREVRLWGNSQAYPARPRRTP